MNPAIPILTYHQVSAMPSPELGKYAVSTASFARQMRWLKRSGHTAIDLDTLLNARAGSGSLPRRPVVITFDDGFRDCVEEAAPILRAHGFTATFYLVAGLIGGTSRWLAAERGPELPLVDWAGARRLLDAGFCCGAHTLTHPRLAELSAEECERQLRDSRRLLERGLGRDVHNLAYPHGSYNEAVRSLARVVGYRSACSVRVGLSCPEDDPLALHRVTVNGGETMLDFLCRLRTARPLRYHLHRAAGRAMPQRVRAGLARRMAEM